MARAATAVRAPERVDGANGSLHQRTLDEFAPTPANAGYSALRDAIAAHFAGRALNAANTGSAAHRSGSVTLRFA